MFPMVHFKEYNVKVKEKWETLYML